MIHAALLGVLPKNFVICCVDGCCHSLRVEFVSAMLHKGAYELPWCQLQAPLSLETLGCILSASRLILHLPLVVVPSSRYLRYYKNALSHWQEG